jgi:hypothetical protein
MSWLAFTLLTLGLFGYTLEVVSGAKILPRSWWLYNNEKPACIVCKDADAFIIPSNESWMEQAKAEWSACVASGSSRQGCDDALRADWLQHGRQLNDLQGNPYLKAIRRFHMAIEARNRSVLWNLIIGGLLHVLSLLMGVLWMLFTYVGVSGWINKAKTSKKRLAY